MGLFSPKYPKSDTSGATGTPARRSRRISQASIARQNLASDFQAAEQASEERSARFWRR